MKYLDAYLERIGNRNEKLAAAIKTTVDNVVPRYISNFSFIDHVVSLLVGDVQSGKTSHMFGLMCAAADESFLNFVLLTTDNVLLQQQTIERAKQDLCDFCICDENDYIKFCQNNLRKPAVVVLKKNSSVLRKWKTNFAGTNFCAGNPLFIVDDEADAASLNTLVNKRKQSTINKNLEAIKKTASSSIYMEVTGTPQSILLQTKKSGWKPYFIYYFKPGEGYLGGNFFFPEKQPKQIMLTDNNEAEEILSDDEFPENGLKRALITHLITSGHIMLNGGTVCNFLIHPSVKTDYHLSFAEKIGNYLNELFHSYSESETIEAFKTVYDSLQQTKKDILPFEQIYTYAIEQIKNNKIKIMTLNSLVSYDENTQYAEGINVIVGGNSLGRGVTFPQLQTIYYCRIAKRPQADTMWQHARMFGYDRDPELMRIFMPPKLYKLFSDINSTNNSIVNQITNANNGSDIKIIYPTGLNPTRKNVIDKNSIAVYSGGVNYFPFYPVNLDIEALDNLLEPFSEDVYSVSLKLIAKILELVGSEINDWDSKAFIGFVNTFLASNPSEQGKLIVRRGRDIGKGTGTLLSPNDRKLGDEYAESVVLTVYKITGNIDKGWDGKQLWIPNIKLPGDYAYYNGENV
ncbi:MAG: Z1 domain-containing protein [Clostridiales bacterium]|nr:Z1 domain-containing protein [Clostridiales bacterium]